MFTLPLFGPRLRKKRGPFGVSPTPKAPSVQRWAYVKVTEIFGSDLRSLATFRIVIAILALFDLLIRATDLTAHYTDAGVMPRTVLIQQVLDPWQFSFNLMNGGVLFQALLFGVAACAAFSMLVGYRTRLMTFVLWALVLSFQIDPAEDEDALILRQIHCGVGLRLKWTIPAVVEVESHIGDVRRLVSILVKTKVVGPKFL